MKTDFLNRSAKQLLSLTCVAALALPFGSLLLAQAPTPPAPPAPPPAPAQLLSPAQLENMVAPVALYPDPLLGQVLAASTYPLEVVQAQQWAQQNSSLHGQQLMDAARQQNWDPSVQALVAFPDILATLTRDVQWTTDLGNAFLAQQNDVMAAVQRMRQRAMRNGKLRSNAQQNVNTQTQDGQSAVVIEPADPQVIYVPVYNPAYIWGPPAWGYYPSLFYPGIGFGFGFGPGIYLGGFYPGWGVGWGGWGLGWGWGCGWFGGGLFVNVGFFNHYGFRGGGFYGGGRFAGGHAAWQHDPMHRAGVAYANRSVAARYNNSRFAAGRTPAAAGRSFNGARSTPSSRAGGVNGSRGSFGASRGANPGYSRSYSNSGASRGYSNSGSSRGYAAPNSGRSFSSPGASSRGYSSPRSSGGGYGGGSRPSTGGSAGRSFGGGGSRSSGGGGGRSGRR